MSELKINPTFRDLIPPLSPYELEALEAEIRHWARAYAPIITWNGTIVDGHHRYEICKKYNLPFKVEEREFEDELSTKRWIIACQFVRRNMPLDVRLDLAFQDEEFEMEQARKRQACGQGGVLLSPLVDTGKVETGRTLEKIAKKALCGRQTAFEYKKIKEAGLVDRVKQDGESIKKVYCDLKLKEEKAKVVEKLESLEVKEVKATEGVYDVISIDPPWDVEDVWSRSAHAGYKPLQYPTMSVEEIKEMKISCAEDCHVFLWTTQKFLPKAFEVIDAWGLEYACTFTWVKNGGPQNQARPQYTTEFFIYAKRGNPKFVDIKDFRTHLIAKRTGHSAKPEEFYDMLRRVTAGRRLDMFNRREIEGFDAWGNEAVI